MENGQVPFSILHLPYSTHHIIMSSTARPTSLLLALLLLTGCVLPDEVPVTPVPTRTPTPVAQPDHCLSDGAVQSWHLLPLQPPESELMAAYDQGQIVEFQARVVGASDDPADLPYRIFALAEAAEGITLTLKYRGDPPPLMFGQDYQLLAWSNPGLETPFGYELQAFDAYGLLFLGATDSETAGDSLGIRIEDAEGDCPVVPATASACVAERQVRPLRVGWGEAEVMLYPGETGEIVHEGRLYEVSLFRNRRVVPVDPPCQDWFEHRRSLRIERLHPPPLMPIIPTETLTATAPITGRLIITPTLPISETVPITPPQR